MKINKNSKRRKELVAIAAQEFYNQSYDTTTVRHLAQAMGIKSGSLFHHFQDKQEILYAVIEAGMESAIKIAQQHLQQANTPVERLRALIQAHLSTLLEDKNAHVVALYEWRSLTEESRASLIQIRDAYETQWQTVMQECQDAGLIKGTANLNRFLALGALNWTVQWYQPAGELTLEEVTDQLMLLLLKEPTTAISTS